MILCTVKGVCSPTRIAYSPPSWERKPLHLESIPFARRNPPERHRMIVGEAEAQPGNEAGEEALASSVTYRVGLTRGEASGRVALPLPLSLRIRKTTPMGIVRRVVGAGRPFAREGKGSGQGDLIAQPLTASRKEDEEGFDGEAGRNRSRGRRRERERERERKREK